MDSRIKKLKTLQECEAFGKNATQRGLTYLAEESRQRAIQIRAENYGAKNDVERECVEAVYAYEEVLSVQKGKRQPATRTWPMLKKYGILPAVERIVLKREETAGFKALATMGLQDYAFEAVILRHEAYFTAEAVARAKDRLAEE